MAYRGPASEQAHAEAGQDDGGRPPAPQADARGNEGGAADVAGGGLVVSQNTLAGELQDTLSKRLDAAVRQAQCLQAECICLGKSAGDLCHVTEYHSDCFVFVALVHPFSDFTVSVVRAERGCGDPDARRIADVTGPSGDIVICKGCGCAGEHGSKSNSYAHIVSIPEMLAACKVACNGTSDHWRAKGLSWPGFCAVLGRPEERARAAEECR